MAISGASSSERNAALGHVPTTGEKKKQNTLLVARLKDVNSSDLGAMNEHAHPGDTAALLAVS